jgi:hypothetical protein
VKRKPIKERLKLVGGSVLLALAIFGTIARRPVERTWRRWREGRSAA